MLKPMQLRDFAIDKHGTVDDRPYGGGAGMVLRIEPIVRAIRSIKESVKVILPTPLGKKWNNTEARLHADSGESMLFVCGRYRGVDQRVIDNYVDECYSVGDYVLSNGELASLIMIDSILRLIPGVLSNPQSAVADSPDNPMHKMPMYTRPRAFEGHEVPEILYSGNHHAVEEFFSSPAVF